MTQATVELWEMLPVLEAIYMEDDDIYHTLLEVLDWKK